jgi:hypothetical protein
MHLSLGSAGVAPLWNFLEKSMRICTAALNLVGNIECSCGWQENKQIGGLKFLINFNFRALQY